MRKYLNLLFSPYLMALLIAIYAIAIAIATFIENDFGTQTARAAVYTSWWFESLLFLGIINLTGAIFLNRLYRKEKLSVFVFHIAFIFILSGAAVTHFIGFQGVFYIREGETSNQMITDNTYLIATASMNNKRTYAEKEIYFSALSNNYYKMGLQVAGKNILIECTEYVPNADENIVDIPNGESAVQLMIAGSKGKQILVLTGEQSHKIGNILFSLNDTSNSTGVNIIFNGNELQVKSAVTATAMNMASQLQEILPVNKYYPFGSKTLYTFQGIQLVIKKFSASCRTEVSSVKDAKPGDYPDALKLRITSDQQSRTILYFATRNAMNKPVDFMFNGVSMSITFGSKVIPIPFSIQLKKFILNRYPGSNSPSWFESKIQLIDTKEKVNEERRIFMNNVLKYRGYRFYQSSYDTDEQGTALFVNHDYWGTLITYFGYIVLGFGMIASLMNRKGRIRRLFKELERIREQRKYTIVFLMFILATFVKPGITSSQGSIPDSIFIDATHASKFGELLIQDPKGRIKPLNSLSSELLRKISRRSEIMGQSSDQVLLGMFIYPAFWQHVPMIKVSDEDIQKILNIKTNYVSFTEVFDQSPQHNYLLSKYVNKAYETKAASRSKFDTEIIRLDERINLCYLIYSEELFRIFPRPGDKNNTWYTPVNVRDVFKGRDSLFVTSLVPMYFKALWEAPKTKNWQLSGEILGLIRSFQNKYGGKIIPSLGKVRIELLYNRLNLFEKLCTLYGCLGFILLVIQFISVFFPYINLRPVIKVFTILIIFCFLVHFIGLMLRWYISGHAPWSNAYESLLYIAFATVLAGIIFSKKTGIAISSTALLAWLILFVANLNWMDPEITNLVPALKSYWLLIHVAIITASYGFMALGAILALINLLLMAVQVGRNYKTTNSIIAELSAIIEITLVIGLYLLTVGMFLGGVWANESWGRYWGWDPKESWALVSVLVYAFIAHMRLVPALRSSYLFNLLALLGFGSIIMTYFGVNYYLSGLHSYAKGDPLPVPVFVYYTLATIAVIAITGWIKQRKLHHLSESQ